MNAEIRNKNRWRCLIVGCNPELWSEEAALEHKSKTGHRVAKWPVRSEEGKRRARLRNKTGYYNKYYKKKSRPRYGRPYGKHRSSFTLLPADKEDL